LGPPDLDTVAEGLRPVPVAVLEYPAKGGEEEMSLVFSGDNWCKRFGHSIDYELVKVKAPPCIDQNHGCANCPECGYKKTVAVNGRVVTEEII
jgi:hypothetical protein